METTHWDVSAPTEYWRPDGISRDQGHQAQPEDIGLGVACMGRRPSRGYVGPMLPRLGRREPPAVKTFLFAQAWRPCDSQRAHPKGRGGGRREMVGTAGAADDREEIGNLRGAFQPIRT